MGLTDLRVLWQRDIGAVMSISCDRTHERYAIVELFRKESVGGQTVVRRMDDDRELFRVSRPEVEFSYAYGGFSPDGQYLLVTYLTSGSVLYDFWHLERRERVFHQAARSSALAFLPDGRRLVFAPPGKDLVVWDLVDRKEVKRLPLEFRPRSLCLDSEGRRIAANADQPQPHQVRIIDLEVGRALATWTENVGNMGMSWSSDGRLLAICDWDSRVFVWDVERGHLASVLQGHTGAVYSCEFAPAGHMLATGGWDGPSRLWDAATGELLVNMHLVGPQAFSPDGRRLAFHRGSHLGISEVAHGDEVLTLNPGLIGNRTEMTGRGAIHLAGFSPDGRLVAVSTQEAVYLYDGHTGGELAQLNAGRCDGVVFNRHGRSLMTYGERGLFRWPIRDDPAAGSDALRIGPPVLLRETTSDSWFKASWLPDGRTLAVLEKTSSRVLLVDTQARHPARKRARALSTPSRSNMTSIAVSPDGRWAAAGGWNDVGIYVWDLPRRWLERILPAGDSLADSQTVASFSPDGRWLVTCSQVGAASGYYFWEVGTWKRRLFVANSGSAGFGEPVFSPDGRVIALSVSPQQVRLAESATGRTIAHLSTLQPLSPTAVAFSPDGTRLIARTHQQTALIWDLAHSRAAPEVGS